jgi:hypothetical protein
MKTIGLEPKIDFIHNRTGLLEELLCGQGVCAHIGVEAGPALVQAQSDPEYVR